MAATVGAWAKPGAWALDSEENEAELVKQQQSDQNNGGAYGHEPEPLADYPTLSTAAMKPKKKKGQTLSLAEFNTGTSRSAQASQAKGLTAEDLFSLPTGPRQRSAEELDRNRLGGGFRQYGSYEGGRSNRYSNGGEDSSNPRWGGSRVSDESRGSGGYNRDSNRETMPSRADEIDDWGAAKKSTVSNGFERRERGGFFDSHSKADESDNWASNKSFVPSSAPGRRFGGGGRGGFDNSRELNGGGGGGADSETWGKKSEIGGGIAGGIGGGSGSGSGSGSGRPRLVLQPRTLLVSNEQQQESGTAVKPKGSNPFGDARPREEVLAEKGHDWKKIDDELESMKIKESGGSADGGSVGKRSFGSGSWRMSSNEDVTEKSWRKTDTVDVDPPSAENGHAEEN